MPPVNVDFQGLSIISCQQCRQRKIKCGRQFPRCQNCIKKDCDCTYPRTLRKTSTKLTKKRKGGNARFYGFSSINRSLFEVGMPFCNVDFELEGENATSYTKRFTSSTVFKKYIENPEATITAIRTVRGSIAYCFFNEIVDLTSLELALCSRHGFDYQILLLSYSVLVVSERFFDGAPDVRDLIAELNLLLEGCPDCPEKVSSYILLTEYYQYNFKLEAAWKCIFLATSVGYALGLHTTSSKVWTMLILQDALLCSVLGRPSSISCINSKLVCRLCNGWGEMAILLRETNEVLLNVKSENSNGKVIALDMKYDDLIERTKKAMNCSEKNENSAFVLLGYLKISIMASSRIKLLFPFFSKHRSIKAQLDENCNSLADCLCGLFQFLTTSGLATEQNKYSLRAHCFPAYCSTFQGFLLQFLFASNELLGNLDKSTDEFSSIFFTKDPRKNRLFLPSLVNTETLIQDYDRVTGKINFCSFMTDLFASFRTLLTQQKQMTEGKMQTHASQNDQSETSPEEQLSTPAVPSEEPSERSGRSSPIVMGDIADWITSCFSDGITYFYPSEQSS